MSKRNHQRNNGGINVSELADALTRNGWRPPEPRNPLNGFGAMITGNSGFPPMSGNGTLSDNLSTLGGFLNNLGSVNPPFPNNGMVGGAPPQTPPMMMNPMAQMAPPRPPQNPPPRPASDVELLKNLFQEILTVLKEK